MPVKMTLSRILIREEYDSHIVELHEVDGPRVFPIVIGPNEAVAIERRWTQKQPPRPQTHELLAEVIERLGATLDHIEICDLKEHTFYAKLILKQNGQTVEIDSRPSDAIALGAAVDIPIFVAESVLNEVCPPT